MVASQDMSAASSPIHSPNLQANRFQRILLLGAILGGFGLRHIQLGTASLWYDETVSVYLAQKSIPDMLTHTAGDIHPPGYYFLLHFWGLLTQPSSAHGLEFLYAWLSLFFGVLILAVLYVLGRKLFTAEAGLVAAWIAAIQPFHLWYSQEVRMYTLGALLSLLCLWLLLRIANRFATQTTRTAQRLPIYVIYILVASAGLYTLYYFVFSLVAVNLLALLLLRNQWQILWRWVAAQIGVLLLWTPWLPIFLHQATNPPVPPWRVPWETWRGVFDSIAESLGALSVGQSPPFEQILPWALLSVLIFALFFYAKSNNKNSLHLQKWIIVLYLLIPITLIYFISYTITPLYHVRYLFTYAPPFVLMMAVAIVSLNQQSRVAGTFLITLILFASLDSLYEFWTNPDYRADDHRGAVADVARMWRPGDVILVNAGWAYPPLKVYWPTEFTETMNSLPPPIAEVERLGEQKIGELSKPTLVRTGSVDGSPNLGWGDPRSDFFAISQADSQKSLAELTKKSRTIWHYRIYDTVSDPQGVLRQQLEQLPTLEDHQHTGRDYLRVQRFLATEGVTIEGGTEIALPNDENNNPPTFGQLLQLTNLKIETDMFDGNENQIKSFVAGETLYLRFRWQPLMDLAALGVNLNMSARLYSPQNQDQAIAQRDEPPFQPTSSWQSNQLYWQTMALGIPVSTEPGIYSLELVVYRQDNGEPLLLPDAATTVYGQRQKLAQLEIKQR